MKTTCGKTAPHTPHARPPGAFGEPRRCRGVEDPAGTYWNGHQTTAARGTAVVAPAPQFPHYWARAEGLIDSRIPVVRVELDGVNYGGGIAYLDNRDGSGWRKVTEGHGGPAWPHRDVAIVSGSFQLSSAAST